MLGLILNVFPRFTKYPLVIIYIFLYIFLGLLP